MVPTVPFLRSPTARRPIARKPSNAAAIPRSIVSGRHAMAGRERDRWKNPSPVVPGATLFFQFRSIMADDRAFHPRRSREGGPRGHRGGAEGVRDGGVPRPERPHPRVRPSGPAAARRRRRMRVRGSRDHDRSPDGGAGRRPRCSGAAREGGTGSPASKGTRRGGDRERGGGPPDPEWSRGPRDRIGDHRAPARSRQTLRGGEAGPAARRPPRDDDAELGSTSIPRAPALPEAGRAPDARTVGPAEPASGDRRRGGRASGRSPAGRIYPRRTRAGGEGPGIRDGGSVHVPHPRPGQNARPVPAPDRRHPRGARGPPAPGRTRAIRRVPQALNGARSPSKERPLYRRPGFLSERARDGGGRARPG